MMPLEHELLTPLITEGMRIRAAAHLRHLDELGFGTHDCLAHSDACMKHAYDLLDAASRHLKREHAVDKRLSTKH